MGNLILNFLQEQGILIMMGLMVLEGIVHQWVASRRYHRLRTGLQSLATSNGQGDSSHQTGQATYGKGAGSATGSVAEIGDGTRKRGRRTSRRQEVGRSAPEIAAGREAHNAMRTTTEADRLADIGPLMSVGYGTDSDDEAVRWADFCAVHGLE